MKRSIKLQEEWGVQPLLMLCNIKGDPEIGPSPHGFPTLEQVSNSLKYMCKKEGGNNTVHATRHLARGLQFDPDSDRSVPFILGCNENEEGLPYVDVGTDEDPLLLGVTSRALLKSCMKWPPPVE